MIVVVTGLPGTGKTTFSKSLARKMKALHLNTDIIRDQLHLRGHYDRTSKQRIYERMCDLVAKEISSKKNVIVDGTFYKKQLRDAYIHLASKHQVAIKWIELKANEATIRERVEKKRTYSEADFEVYLKVKASFEPIHQARLELWTDQDLEMEDLLLEALEYLDQEIKSKNEQ